MQYLSAYALASLSGKEPTADSVNAVLKATGKPFDQKEVKKVVDSLKGKNVEELIKKGMSKVGSVSSSAPAPAGGKKEEKKEDKKKQQKKPQAKTKQPQPAPVDDDMDGPGDLFG